ncbi:MAG: hypothetical protein IPJ74_06580 [Saprospiraceae bacterium]|nr:hypothetical protein [Saprospiraceae bacterium]
MRHLLFSLLLLLFGQAAAQDADVFIVTGVSGKVNYLDKKSSKEQSLLPGQQLSPDATVILANNARANLVHKKKSVVLDKAGRFLLQTIANQNAKESSGLINRFFDYIQEGVTNTSNAKKLEKYHEQYMTKASGGVKGWAGGELGIIPSVPVAGVLNNASVTFAWFDTGDSSFYDFQILDYQTDGLIFKALLRDTFITVELQKLVLDAERKYKWVVQKKLLGESAVSFTFSDDPGKSSPEMEFVMNNGEMATVLASLEKEEEYQNADTINKKLMEALLLENNQYMYEAYLRFKEAQELVPDNQLVKNLRAVFLTRQGLLRAGTEALIK